MYSVTVRDHFMIAHSFTGEVFGPAQRLHGATYVVDVEFRRPELDADGIVVDIGRATETLQRVLAELNFRNLDEDAGVRGAQHDHGVPGATWSSIGIVAAIGRGDLGPGARAVESLRVTLHESHVASGVVRRTGRWRLSRWMPSGCARRCSCPGGSRRAPAATATTAGWSPASRASRLVGGRPRARRQLSRSHAGGARRRGARARRRSLTAATVLVDGLALGAHAGRGRARSRAAAARRAGASSAGGRNRPRRRDDRGRLEASERRALAAVRLVVVTEPRDRRRAGALRRWPRSDRASSSRAPIAAPLARGSRGGPPSSLLCVATLIPRKGHDVLLRALATIAASPLAPDLRRQPRPRSGARSSGCARIAARRRPGGSRALAGEVDDTDAGRAATTAPTCSCCRRCHEGYGMAVAEALARGLPVVSTTTGAIPSWSATKPGIVVPPGDRSALAARALARVAMRPALRGAAGGGRAAGARAAADLGRGGGADGATCSDASEPTDGRVHAPTGWRCASRPTVRRAFARGSRRVVADALPRDATVQRRSISAPAPAPICATWRTVCRAAGLAARRSRSRRSSRKRQCDSEWPPRAVRARVDDGVAAAWPRMRASRLARANRRSLDDRRDLAGRHLVTASALLDLVSEPWLRALARALPRRRRGGAVRAHLRRPHRLLSPTSRRTRWFASW